MAQGDLIYKAQNYLVKLLFIIDIIGLTYIRLTDKDRCFANFG